LHTGISDDTTVTVCYHNGKKATHNLDAQGSYEIVGQNVLNDEAEPKEIANDSGDEQDGQVDEYDDPPRENFQLVNSVDEKIPLACHMLAAASHALRVIPTWFEMITWKTQRAIKDKKAGKLSFKRHIN
jgi:hypothetical protein